VTAVVVWDKHPSADELLSFRLSIGWKPMTSRLAEGDKIVGHAGCVLE